MFPVLMLGRDSGLILNPSASPRPGWPVCCDSASPPRCAAACCLGYVPPYSFHILYSRSVDSQSHICPLHFAVDISFTTPTEESNKRQRRLVAIRSAIRSVCVCVWGKRERGTLALVARLLRLRRVEESIWRASVGLLLFLLQLMATEEQREGFRERLPLVGGSNGAGSKLHWRTARPNNFTLKSSFLGSGASASGMTRQRPREVREAAFVTTLLEWTQKHDSDRSNKDDCLW